MAKVLAKLVADEIRPIVLNAAQHIPQFAFLEGQQTCDAIDRAFGHCREIRERRQNATVTTRDRRAGKTAQTISGGITLSLDLRKAFDSIPWKCLQEYLVHFQIPASAEGNPYSQSRKFFLEPMVLVLRNSPAKQCKESTQNSFHVDLLLLSTDVDEVVEESASS